MRPLGLWRWGAAREARRKQWAGTQEEAGQSPGCGLGMENVQAGFSGDGRRLGERLHSSILSCAWAWQPEGPLYKNVPERMPWNQAPGEPSGQGVSEEPGQGDKGRLICRNPSPRTPLPGHGRLAGPHTVTGQCWCLFIASQ